MLFSTPTFLFLFLPCVLPLYFLVPRSLRNIVLLLASLIFYAWGEPKYLAVMLFSVELNYVLGLLVDRAENGWRKASLGLAVVMNVGLLAFYKYAVFFLLNLNALLSLAHAAPIQVPEIELPLGISFFTFHALSYVIDVYRKQTPPQRNLFLITLYIAFFPQLIAGPIIRYHEVSDQLRRRVTSLDDFVHGSRRFVLGLGKKVLIANTLAIPADAIFALAPAHLSGGLSWLGALCYALQIYFDFSGYSDMALGLARMFGFRFAENFNYPYIARSLTDFWRRWHISLSRWFRDYLYIPLGGNRKGPVRTYVNLIVVFFLCGLWHGASWNFVIWGFLHGAFLVFERTPWGKWVQSAPTPIGNAYTLFVVLGTWVFFRSPTLSHSLGYLRAMVGGSAGARVEYPLSYFLNAECLLALYAGIIGSALMPLATRPLAKLRSLPANLALSASSLAAVSAVFVLCVMRLSAGTYNPFIYFRF